MSTVVVYVSSVAGSLQAKKHQKAIEDLLTAKKIAFTTLDLSLKENEKAKEEMQKESGKTIIPQVFVNGKFKGLYDDLFEANEDGQLKQFLSLE